MKPPYPVFCDAPELAVECAVAAQALGVHVDPQLVAAPFDVARIEAAAHHGLVAIATAEAPAVKELVGLQGLAERPQLSLSLAVIGRHPQARTARDVASDLGVVATDEIAPLVSVLALREAGAAEPWTSSTRSLSAVDRMRLRGALDPSQRTNGMLLAGDGALLSWASGSDATPRTIGRPTDVAQAIVAMRMVNRTPQAMHSSIEGVDERAVLDVLFGPARALSDPASKAALIPYGIPVPEEELCGSASRAASEATRIGFPVRIALASPDLRVWQHPDLVVDMVDNAARVRETFRLLTALAQSRAPNARILGVTVAATSDCHALLRVELRPLPGGLVETCIGFADSHGLAANDSTTTIMPTSVANLGRVLSRLKGSGLILEGSTTQRRATVSELADVLLRAAAFVTTHAVAVSMVELRPLALLTGGGAEVREVCVTISDTFEQTYQRASALG